MIKVFEHTITENRDVPILAPAPRNFSVLFPLLLKNIIKSPIFSGKERYLLFKRHNL